MVTNKLDHAAAEKLLTSIREAFDDVEREDGISLREAEVIDDCGGEREQRKARRLDNESHWSEVTFEDLERYHWMFTYLDAKGFRYYLPAVMSLAINELPKRDCDSPSSLLSCLTPRKNRSNEIFERYIALLSQSQKEVVRTFRWWLIDSYYAEDAFIALDRYWEHAAQ